MVQLIENLPFRYVRGAIKHPFPSDRKPLSKRRLTFHCFAEVAPGLAAPVPCLRGHRGRRASVSFQHRGFLSLQSVRFRAEFRVSARRAEARRQPGRAASQNPLTAITNCNIVITDCNMNLGEKIRYLREVEGALRGFDRAMTQQEVVRAIAKELKKTLSQSYLSQIESGARPHLTNTSRMLLAKFFKVHPGLSGRRPGGLLDGADLRPGRARRQARPVAGERRGALSATTRKCVSPAALANHPDSRRCLMLLRLILENPGLADRLFDVLGPKEARELGSFFSAVSLFGFALSLFAFWRDRISSPLRATGTRAMPATGHGGRRFEGASQSSISAPSPRSSCGSAARDTFCRSGAGSALCWGCLCRRGRSGGRRR